MCKARTILIAAILSLWGFSINAQSPISVEKLLQRALDSSFVLTSNEYLIQRSHLRNTSGYAGNLPSIQASGQSQIDLNSSRLQFFDGNTRTANNAANYSAGISMDLTYPIYEAGAKAARKDQLQNQLENSQIQYKLSQQDLLREVLLIASEYNLWRKNVEIYSADTVYWNEILDLQEQIFEFGKGNRIELIQVESELNASIAQLSRNQQQLDILYTQLAGLAFLKEENSIDSIRMTAFLDQAMVRNEDYSLPALELEKNQLKTALLANELAKSLQFPVISAFAGYGYNWSRNAVGILLSNQNFGPYVGIRLNWNIYSGNQTKIDIQSAELQAASERSDLRAVERDINYQIEQFSDALRTQQQILKQEEKQRKMLQQQYDLVEAQYKEGKIDILEVLNYKRQVLLNQLNIAQAQHLIRTYKIQLMYHRAYLANYNR